MKIIFYIAHDIMAYIPPKEQVLSDGSISLTWITATEADLYPQLLTDLKDIDYTNLRNAKPWEIWVLAYIPNNQKRFWFIKMLDPRYHKDDLSNDK